MHPRIDEVLSYYDEQQAQLERAADSVPVELQTRRPRPDHWCVAEIIAHIAIVEERVTHLLGSIIEVARSSGLGPEHEMPAVIPTVDINRLLDRSQRITSSLHNVPPRDVESAAAWAELRAAHTALRALLLQVDGLALSEVVAPHPVLGPINVYQWIVFLGAHQARHAAQIIEMQDEPGNES